LTSCARAIDKDKSVIEDVSASDIKACGRISLTGPKADAVVSYRRNKDTFKILRHVTFPSIKIVPEKKNASFRYHFSPKIELMLDGVEIRRERLLSVSFKGNLVLKSAFMNGATVLRSFYPSLRYPALIEKIEVTNETKTKVTFTAEDKKNRLTDKSVSVRRVSHFILGGKLEVGSRVVDTNGDFRSANVGQAKKLLVPDASGTCYIIHYAIRKGEVLNFNAEKEIKDRNKSLQGLNCDPVLLSDCKELDTLFAHSLARCAECYIPDDGKTTSIGETTEEVNTNKNFASLLPYLTAGSGETELQADDRLSTLKNAFLSGDTQAYTALCDVAKTALLCAAGPYPSDSNDTQPALLSSLFCNAVLEGAFGLEPVSLTKLAVRPKISAKLSGLRYSGSDFDLDTTGKKIVIRMGTKQYSSEDSGIFDFASLLWNKEQA